MIEIKSSENTFRQVILLSLLSGQAVIIKNIRSDEQDPGLKPHEIDLLKLLEKLTNGTQININKTGTRLIFTPGILDAGEGLPITYNCLLDRSITYYLEVVCIIAIFSKYRMNLTLLGNTDSDTD